MFCVLLEFRSYICIFLYRRKCCEIVLEQIKIGNLERILVSVISSAYGSCLSCMLQECVSLPFRCVKSHVWVHLASRPSVWDSTCLCSMWVNLASVHNVLNAEVIQWSRLQSGATVILISLFRIYLHLSLFEKSCK